MAPVIDRAALTGSFARAAATLMEIFVNVVEPIVSLAVRIVAIDGTRHRSCSEPRDG